MVVLQKFERFREEVRDWIEKNCPLTQRKPATQEDYYFGGSNGSFRSEDQKLWFERMRDRGWTAPGWPEPYGGGGLSPQEESILEEEMQRLNCRPPLVGMGLYMIGPAILKFGTDAQKENYLPRIARGEVHWCQGYSEPNAGSDLAALQCSGVIEGDELVLNGSKIWSSMASRADWMFCLVRTDRLASKHEGISFVLVDLRTRGITIRPINLIDGNAEFCEVFFDDAHVPLVNVLGDLNQGWAVAKYLLQFERMAMVRMEKAFSPPRRGPLDFASRYLAWERDRIADSGLRRRITRHRMMTEALDFTVRRVEEEGRAGLASAERAASILKYGMTEEEKRKRQLVVDVMGMQGLGWEGAEFEESEIQAMRDWLYGLSFSIAGGTSEIQLNIIAKRVLGLPVAKVS